MIRARMVLLVVLIAATAFGQRIDLPNPDFEKGDKAPANWALHGSGDWRSLDSGRAIVVTGTGKASSQWLSDPVPLEPAQLYRLGFAARAVGPASGGTATSGTPFCNRDLGHPLQDWQRYEMVFQCPAKLDRDAARLRFGQWEVNGTLAYDNIALHAVIPVYTRSGDIELGLGERLDGPAYSFDAIFRGDNGNHSRPLQSFTCGFNSNRWTLGAGAEAIYRHAIGALEQRAARVQVGVSYHTAGTLAVEASGDGKSWRRMGTLDKVTSAEFAIPADLLPAKEVWIRLLGAGDAAKKNACNLQVADYSYRANVPGNTRSLAGHTQYVTVERTDPKLNVTLHGIGQAIPGGDNQVSLKVLRNSTELTEIDTTIEVAMAGAAPARRSQRMPLGAVSLPYDIPAAGTGELRISVGEFRAVVPLSVPELHNTGYGFRLSRDNAPIGIWCASSGWKISASRPLPREQGDFVQVSLARNETEAVQVVIRPSQELKNFTARTNVLCTVAGQVFSGSVEVLRVGYVDIQRPTDSTGCVGEWPDPLPPLTSPVTLAANRNHPLWIRVRAGKDVKPGTYGGELQLRADGFSQDLLFRVTVYDFALPDRSTCVSAFGFSASEVFRYHGLKTPEHKRLVLEKYLANLAAHRISPYNPAPLDPIKVTWPDKKAPLDQLQPKLDFTAWDAAMTRAFDVHHFNGVMINMPGMGGGTFHERYEPELLGFKESSPEYQALFTSYCRQIEQHLKDKGWLDRAYTYWFDEPDPKDYAFVSNGFRKLRAHVPGIGRMLTEQVEEGLVGGPNIWCPVTPEYNHEKAEARRKQGEKFWWYVCCAPKAPYATLFIDHPATEMRAWLWQTWQRKIDGILIWQTNYWTSSTAYPDSLQNPWADPMSWVSGYGTPKGAKQPWGNGDGRFIYPPIAAAGAKPAEPVLDGPVDSIRWEMLRDGVEDYEYLVILRDLLKSSGAALPADQRQALEKLLEVPAAITKDITTFTRDPGPIERRREEIAKAIEALSR